jgi:hypothetical protein
MFDVIDDDEWFELSLVLNDTMARLPEGSLLVESLEIPAFRPAIKASGRELASVETVSFAPGQPKAQDAVRSAMRLAADREAKLRPGALTVAVTQTDDGSTVAIAVAGLPGERCSFSSFDLRPGSHNIDVGFETLQMLNGWAFRSDRATGSAASRTHAA